LLVLPEAKGLFRRAALQSLPGTYFTAALAHDIATSITAELGREPRVDDLVDLPPDNLVEATRTITAQLPQRLDRWGPVAHTPTPFSPVMDVDPWAMLRAGAARGVQLLIGHTRDEFSQLAAKLEETDNATPIINALTPTPGADRYRAAYPSLSPTALRDTALSDWLMRMP
ncbi:carboxylesterase/lipase family protein, partial [Kibdelosporangium lantanae]